MNPNLEKEVMFIRNIITSAAIAAFLGLAGGSAYAFNTDSHNDEDFTVSANANHPGTVYGDMGDSDIDTGEILTGGFEKARLPEHLLETLKVNYCSLRLAIKTKGRAFNARPLVTCH